MKIVCLKYPRNTVTDILICLLCIFVIILILMNGKTTTVFFSEDNSIIAFIEQNGWQVDTESVRVKTISLPIQADDTYSDYMLLQESQGFSLEPYMGKNVIQYSFSLLNYPEYENSNDIYINILTYNNAIIGGDICCVSINGFITGVIRDVNNPTG